MTARKYVITPDGQRHDCGRATNGFTHAMISEYFTGWYVDAKFRSGMAAAKASAAARDLGRNALAIAILTEADQ